MQFRIAAQNFLQFCTVERQLSEHTLKAYAADLADFNRWLPVETPVTDISEGVLKGYLAEMIGERKLAVATVRRRFACLRAVLKRLSELREISDPFANWRPKLPRKRRLPRTLSRVEASSLVLSLNGGQRSAQIGREKCLPIAVRLMIGTGIRVGELCKLRIDDLPPDGSAIRIHGKGSRDRVAYVTDPTLGLDLCNLVRQRREAGGLCDSLFVNRYGSTMKPQSIRSKLRRYAAETGLVRRVTPHMLRHTAATLLIETGVDIRFVQRLLGHSSIATTEIYTHVSDEALRTTLARADVLAMLGQ